MKKHRAGIVGLLFEIVSKFLETLFEALLGKFGPTFEAYDRAL
jgi:hypothetical protein